MRAIRGMPVGRMQQLVRRRPGIGPTSRAVAAAAAAAGLRHPGTRRRPACSRGAAPLVPTPPPAAPPRCHHHHARPSGSSCRWNTTHSAAEGRAAAAARKKERQMADVLQRKLQEGARPAWNYLGRVGRKGSANAHHCSMMLGVCESAEDLQRLEDYITEYDVGVDDVLARQLHRAWLHAGCPEPAVRCLMAFVADSAEAVESTLAELLRRSDSIAVATDYLAALLAAGFVELPQQQLWSLLQRQGDLATQRRWLLENGDRLTPPACRVHLSTDPSDVTATTTLNTDISSAPAQSGEWVLALHSAWVNVGEISRGVALLSRAVAAGAVDEQSARERSVAQIHKLQRRKKGSGGGGSDASAAEQADAYLEALLLEQGDGSDLVRAEHFAAALSRAGIGVAEGRAVVARMQAAVTSKPTSTLLFRSLIASLW